MKDKIFSKLFMIVMLIILFIMSVFFGIMFIRLHKSSTQLEQLKDTMAKQKEQYIEMQKDIDKLLEEDNNVVFSWSYDGNNWVKDN